MKLITELHDEDVTGLVVESINGKKNYIFEGIFIQCEIVNGNKRKYRKDQMLQEVKEYTESKINSNQALGELNHPQSPNINYERASHKIISLKESGNDFIGKAKVLTALPMGKIVAGLIEEDVKFGVSTRGTGEIVKIGQINEVRNYKLATAADVVSDPSASSAWMKGIMEGADWVYNDQLGWQKLEQIEEMKKTIDKDWKQINEEKTLKWFNLFLSTVSNRNQ